MQLCQTMFWLYALSIKAKWLRVHTEFPRIGINWVTCPLIEDAIYIYIKKKKSFVLLDSKYEEIR